MTVKLLATVSGLPVGSRVSRDYAYEQRLVQAGKATFDLTGSYSPNSVDDGVVGIFPSVAALNSNLAAQEHTGLRALVGMSAPYATYVSTGATWERQYTDGGNVDVDAYAFRAQGGVVAAFYYGEWKTPGTSYRPSPWDSLQPYSDRLPVISQKISAGVYGLPADNAAAVEWEQRQAMAAGIDVFIHNAYWFGDPEGQPAGNITHDSIELHATCSAGMKFAVQWSNHGASGFDTLAKFNAAIDYMLSWVTAYPAKYWKINGLPVFYVFDMENVGGIAQSLFSEPNIYKAMKLGVEHMQARAIALGLPGLFVVSLAGSDHPYWTGRAAGFVGANENAGCGAQSVYNRQHAFTERVQNSGGGDAEWSTRFPSVLSRYEQLTEIYRLADDWIINGSGSQLPVFAGAMCGWDRKPWSDKDGRPIESSDNCAASPDQWLAHLRQQRGFAMLGTRGASGVPPVVNMYAWNEYGEGGFLCPSRRYGWSMLEQVRQAFGYGTL